MRCDLFQEAKPVVRVQVHGLSTQEMLHGLRNGKLHVMLLIQVSAKVLSRLAFEELHRYAVCVAVLPAHPLARARKVGLEQVANERLIAYRLKDANAPAVEKSITAAKRAKSQQAEASTFDRCNNGGYIYTVRTSCRFAVAVHVLAVLAYKEGEAVTSARLAGSVNTNPVVIRRLLLLLQAAGVIETRKGAGAGSRLSRAPGRITLAEVYQAVETDEPFASHSKPPNKACPVGNCIQAALEKVFASAKAALQQELAKTNLADILESVQVSCARSGKGRK